MDTMSAEATRLLDEIAGAAYAAKAIAACSLAGVEPSRENVALCVGQWFNPASPAFETWVLLIDRNISEIEEAANKLTSAQGGFN